MTVECTFCNDTKKEPGQEGPCMWCTGSIDPKEAGKHTVQRHTIARLRYAGGDEFNVKYVSEVDYDRIAARCDQLQRDLTARDEEVDTLRANPAEQRQGEPVVLPEQATDTESCSALMKRIGLYGSVNIWHGGRIWNACLDEIAKLGPLYTHADPGEVERLHSRLREEQAYVSELAEQNTTLEKERDTLRADVETMRGKNNEYWHETETLRAQLAELVTALKSIRQACDDENSHGYIDMLAGDALSASAEPSAPVEVLAQADGVLTFMRSDIDSEHKCACCDGVHVFCRYFEGMTDFNDLTQAARFRNDLEGRVFRVVLQLLPTGAALEHKA